MKKLALSVIFLIICLNLLSENISLKRFEIGMFIPFQPKLSFESEIEEEPYGFNTKCFFNKGNLPIYLMYQYMSSSSKVDISTVIIGSTLASKGKKINVFCDIGVGSAIVSTEKNAFSSLCFAMNSSVGSHINLRHFSISPSVGTTSFANANIVSAFIIYINLNLGYIF